MQSQQNSVGEREQEAFNSYVDQILPNFDHLPPLSGQLWTLDTTYFPF